MFVTTKMHRPMYPDSLGISMPVVYPAVDVMDIFYMYMPDKAAIVYEKGAAMARLMSSFMGSELYDWGIMVSWQYAIM